MKTPARIVRTAILISLVVYVLPTCDAFGHDRRQSIALTQSRPKYEPRMSAQMDSSSSTLRLPSESKAAYLSLATTLIPFVIGAKLANSDDSNPVPGAVIAGTALIIGPSSGYFYGGCSSRGLDGMIVRLMTGAVAGVVSWKLAGTGSDWLGLENTATTVYIGGAIIGIEALYDLGAVRSTVRKRNASVASTTVSLGPGFSLSGDALTLNLTFKF